MRGKYMIREEIYLLHHLLQRVKIVLCEVEGCAIL